MPFEYALVLLLCSAVPLVMSFSKDLNFYASGRRLVLAIAIPMVAFVLWDMVATQRGHWSFNPRYTFGLELGNLPIEEVLFFIVVPFCALFTWESVKYFLRRRR
jgi:lycopene cyclase domain-containing protein